MKFRFDQSVVPSSSFSSHHSRRRSLLETTGRSLQGRPVDIRAMTKAPANGQAGHAGPSSAPSSSSSAGNQVNLDSIVALADRIASQPERFAFRGGDGSIRADSSLALQQIFRSGEYDTDRSSFVADGPNSANIHFSIDLLQLFKRKLNLCLILASSYVRHWILSLPQPDPRHQRSASDQLKSRRSITTCSNLRPWIHSSLMA